MNKNENVIWILSTDIGSTNFAFCIEEVNISKLEGIKNIPKNQRYNLDGTNTYEFSKILEDIYSSGKTILIRNLNLKVGTTKEYEIFNNDSAIFFRTSFCPIAITHLILSGIIQESIL